MEDIGSVLWIVIIVGAMVFNVISQSRKARGKGHHAPEHGEAWPSSTMQPTIPARGMESEATVHPKPQSIELTFPDECQSLEEIPEQEYTPESIAFKTTEMNYNEHSTTTSDEIDVHSNAPSDKNNTAIVGEFDLRRAVIYSEILKPKFEE